MNTRAVAVLVATLAFAALTARLGMWQLDRAAQKIALRDADERQRDRPPLSLADLALTAADATAQRYRAIHLEGRWLPAHTVFLDNRQMNGRVGFYVLTPLLLSDGSAVVVQRGWQPRDQLDRSRVVMPPTPADAQVALRGRIAPPPTRLYEFAGDDAGTIRQNLDLAGFAREVGRPLRPLSILLDDAAVSVAGDDGLLRQWARPASDVHKHYGYAFQWFALCALSIGLYAWFQIIRPRRRRQPA